MPNHHRAGLLIAALLVAVCPIVLAADEKDRKIDPATATVESPAPKGAKEKILWYDIRELGVEGQAWQGGELASPFDRLPAKAEKKVRKPVWDLSRHSTGLLVRFSTDSEFLYGRWTLTSSHLAMPHMPATGVSGLDLYARAKHGWHWAAIGIPSKATTSVQLIRVSPQKNDYLLYLPLYNGVSKVELGLSEKASLWKAEPYPAGHEKPIVFYGTSITQGGCASRPAMVHTSILQRRLNRPVINLGFSGNGKLELELADLMAEIDAAVYVIDCVPNLGTKEIAERAEPFIKSLRAKRPTTPILMVEDRTYGQAEVQPAVQKNQQASRLACKTAYENLKKAGVEDLYYMTGDKILGESGEDMVDGSHPTDLGFVRYADAFEPILKSILQAK